MLTEETKKKLWLWGMIAVVIIGVFWLVFVVLFNRGTLKINGEAPFVVRVVQLTTENCLQSPCEIILAPAEYSLEIQKDGYKTVYLDVKVPIFGETIHDIDFLFQSYLTLLGSESELKYFETDSHQNLNLPENYYFEDYFAVFIDRNKENGRQTLYYREIIDGEAQEQKVATSFIRDLKDYELFPFIESEQKIVVLDKTAEATTLYIIDLSEKTRDNVLSYPLIEDVRWIFGTDNFLFEARDQDSISTSVFYYDGETATDQKMPFKTGLNNVVLINQNTLYAVTNQGVIGVEQNGSLEGQLVSIGETSATNSINIIEYDIDTAQSRLIKSESTLTSVDKIKIGPDQKALILLSGDSVYEMRFDR